MSKFLTDSSSAWKNAWSKGNIGNSISSVASGVTGVASAFGENSRLNDSKINSIQNQIDDISNTQFGYGDYDSLQGSFINPQVQDFSAYSLGKTDGEKVIGTLKGAASGAMAGASVGGPVGAIVGGAIGLGSGIIGGLFGSSKAKREAERLEQEASDARNMYLANFANNAEQISRNKFNTAALNLAAFGGMLKNNNIDNFTKSRVRLHAFGGDMFSPLGREDGFSNGVVKINEGGTHETNPNDGVLMGVDPAGTPNLVEQGEVLFNDYVFSNRLYPTGGQLESVRLPKRYEGKSYSDIAWDLQKESELNPLDAISKNTLIDSMAKLTTLQEESRERDREYQAFDNLEQAFADGGDIHIKKSKVGTFTAAAKKRGMGVQEFASTVLANKDRYSPAMVRKANFAHNSAGWKHAFGGNLYASGSIISELKSRGFTTDAAKKQMEINIKRAFGKDGSQVFGGGEFGGAGASGSFAYDPEDITLFDYVRNTPIPVETSFSNAYAQARKDGLKTFMFNGKEYTTDYDPNAKLGPREYETTLANLRQVLDENRKEIPDSTRIEPWAGQIPGEYKRIRAFGGPIGNIFEGDGEYPNFLGVNPYNFNIPNFTVWSNPIDVNGAIINLRNTKPEVRTDLLPAQNNNPVKEAKSTESNIPEIRNNSFATAMRAIPVVGSAINYLGDVAGWRNKEDYTWSDRIGNAARTIGNVRSAPIGRYLTYKPYDIDYDAQRAENIGLGAQSAILDTVGGNAMAARNALLTLNNNMVSQRGDLRRAGAMADEQRRNAIQQFNAGIDQFNAGQSLNSQIYNQRADEERVYDIIRQSMLADSIQSATSQARSAEETAALNNAGLWGNDMMFNDMARWYARYVAPYNNATRRYPYGANTGSKGGKVKKIKGFGK